jgi:hypothetical protein
MPQRGIIMQVFLKGKSVCVLPPVDFEREDNLLVIRQP